MVTNPPKIKNTTCITSVQATAERPPYNEYAAAKRARPITPYIIGTPMMVSSASEPKYSTEAKFTNTYKQIQKTAKIDFRLVENRFSTNSGMVYNPFSINMGKKYFPTMIKVIAAIHSYEAIASPNANPDPDIPINCSAEMLAAINDAPMAHHGSDLLARK